MHKIIYLDYNSTTPLDPRVLQTMMPYFTEHFGNPASQHPYGWKAEEAVKKSRSQVASLLHSKSSEVYFTSGATESNNWAILGLYAHFKKNHPQEEFHALTSQAEHKSVLQSFEQLESLGGQVEYLPVNSYGQLEPTTVEKALRPTTRLLSAMAVNNELGTLNPVHSLGALAKKHHLFFHCDATQGVGKISLDISSLQVDLLSLSAHKFYGPKGVGALFIRSQNPKVQISPYLLGGGQEKGLRSTTLNVPGIVGLGSAAEIAIKEGAEETRRIQKLRDELFERIQKVYPRATFNGHPIERSCNTLSLTLPGISSELLLAKTSFLCVSQGSACQSGSMKSSHVLAAIGLSDDLAASTVRLSLGRFTTSAELEEVARILATLAR